MSEATWRRIKQNIEAGEREIASGVPLTALNDLDSDDCHPILADLQLEAIRGVLEELLTTSGCADPRTWGPGLLGELSHILDMKTGLEVMGVLADQEERRGK
jgi:hypothetical protein